MCMKRFLTGLLWCAVAVGGLIFQADASSLPSGAHVSRKPMFTSQDSLITICQGDTALLTASMGDFFTWNNGQNTQSIKVTEPGTFTVMVYNENGCFKESSSINVVVNPRPKATISQSGPTTLCQNESVVLRGPDGMAAYKWSNGLETQEITVTTPGRYALTVTNSSGCSELSDSVEVKVYPKPKAKIEVFGDTEFCKGGSVLLNASGGDYYVWSTGAKSPSITVTKPGSYSVQVLNELGCYEYSEVIRVVVYEPTPLPYIPNENICINGGLLTLDKGKPAGGKYSGLGVSGNVFNPVTADVGRHKIEYSYTNENGCESKAYFTVVVTPLTKLVPAKDTVVCDLSASFFLTHPGIPDGVVFSGVGVDGNKFSPKEAGVGKHEILYTYINESSCVTTANRIITVNATPDAPVVSGNTEGCRLDFIRLSATSDIEGNTPIVFQWFKKGAVQPFFVGKDLTYQITGIERIYVSAKSTLPGSCESSLTEVKISATNPEGDFITTARLLPQGGFVKLTPIVVGATNYEWDFGDGFTSKEEAPTHYYNGAGTFAVKLTAISKDGCVLVVQKANYITVFEEPVAHAPAEPETEPSIDPHGMKTNFIFPNPVSNGQATLRVYNKSESETTTTVEIYTINGQLLNRKTFKVGPGSQEIALTDMHFLAANSYYLFTVKINSVVKSYKMLVL